MKELNNNIPNIQNSYLSDIDEYSFTVSHGKISANVILKLDATGDNIAKEEIVKGLVQYISEFEDIMTWQSEN